MNVPAGGEKTAYMVMVAGTCREELLEHVWGTRFQDPATVTEHIRRVRAKIEKHPPTRKVLTTLRGMGYRFDP